jgi:5-oxoprolinase (ATP-hydrolysing) subunit A
MSAHVVAWGAPGFVGGVPSRGVRDPLRVPHTIDLNCDVGEERGDDAAVMPFITSASVACGLHAGGPGAMRATVAAAAAAGVAVGAHPGYADREGFGRRETAVDAQAVFDLVLYQIAALDGFARQAGVRLQHVKPHGALYHAASTRPEVAEAIARATAAVRADLILIGPPASALAAAAAAHQLRFAGELFADRHYGEDGRLLPRSHPQALVAGDDALVAARAVAMVKTGAITTLGGASLAQPGASICLHGDTPGAPSRARAIRAALEQAGVRLAPLGSWL